MRERVLCFGDGADLVGILTTPDESERAETVVLLLNAGLLHRVGPHRLYVQMARRLAHAGLATLRFDLAGIGDSGPRRDRLRGREAIIAETKDAIDAAIAVTGGATVVVGGLCSGADQAYHVALADERVGGLLWIDGFPFRTRGWYLRHYRKRLLRRRSWENVLTGRHPVWKRVRTRLRGWLDPSRVEDHDEAQTLDPLSVRDIPSRAEVEQGLTRFVGRGATLYALYTAGLLQYVNGVEQFGEMYPSLAGDRRVRLAYLGVADHTCTLRASQARVVDTLVNWLS